MKRRLTKSLDFFWRTAAVPQSYNNSSKISVVRFGGSLMLGTAALVVLFTLTALGVVLYAAYCEAGEDLPCKRARPRGESSHAKMTESSHQKGNH